MRYISRDPFARATIMRSTEYTCGQTCAWCGSVRRTPTGRPHLYRYNVMEDTGREGQGRNLFCSIECCRAYES